MTDPVEIARGLSEAQKRALLWLPEDGEVRCPERQAPPRPRTITLGLLKRHKLAACHACICNGRWEHDYWLLPLGLAVRTALVARLAAEEGDARDGGE